MAEMNLIKGNYTCALNCTNECHHEKATKEDIHKAADACGLTKEIEAGILHKISQMRLKGISQYCNGWNAALEMVEEEAQKIRSGIGEFCDEVELLEKIVKWHTDPAITCKLHEYLGMSWEEYSDWMTFKNEVEKI